MLKIHIKQNTYYYLMNKKILLLKIQMIWMIFIKILSSTIWRKNTRYRLHLMIWLMTCSAIKRLNPIVTELFINGRTLNIFIAFTTQSVFAVPRNTRLSSTHYLINFKQTRASTNWKLSFIRYFRDFRDFISLYKQ